MKTYRKRIKFQVGELGGPGNCCAFSTMATFDYEDGDIVARADGYTGKGATTYKAALDWCHARLGYDAPNAHTEHSAAPADMLRRVVGSSEVPK